jgi:UDP-N-acetylmuramyl pentapeptide phosphotransferase/UDP-N-acetylglucosamine-1-phosphate transferase
MHAMSYIVIGLLLGLVAMSFAFAGGAVIVTLPLAVIGIGVIGFLDLRRRAQQAKQVHDFREQARTEKVDFTSRDQETLVSE